MKNPVLKTIVLVLGMAGIFSGCSKSASHDKTQDPHRFTLAREDIVSPVEIVTNDAKEVEVQFWLPDAKAKELRKFVLKDDPDFEIFVGSTVIAKWGLQSELVLSNGLVRVVSTSSNTSDIQAIGESLRKN